MQGRNNYIHCTDLMREHQIIKHIKVDCRFNLDFIPCIYYRTHWIVQLPKYSYVKSYSVWWDIVKINFRRGGCHTRVNVM